MSRVQTGIMVKGVQELALENLQQLGIRLKDMVSQSMQLDIGFGKAVSRAGKWDHRWVIIE